MPRKKRRQHLAKKFTNLHLETLLTGASYETGFGDYECSMSIGAHHVCRWFSERQFAAMIEAWGDPSVQERVFRYWCAQRLSEHRPPGLLPWIFWLAEVGIDYDQRLPECLLLGAFDLVEKARQAYWPYVESHHDPSLARDRLEGLLVDMDVDNLMPGPGELQDTAEWSEYVKLRLDRQPWLDCRISENRLENDWLESRLMS